MISCVDRARRYDRGMPQHTIGISEEVFSNLRQFQHRMAMAGKHYSLSRLVDYLIQIAGTIYDRMPTLANIGDKDKRGHACEQLLLATISLVPSPILKKHRPCHRATPEQRAYVTQQIIERLGILSPSKQLVDAYLDQGGMDPMIGSKLKDMSDDYKQRLSAEHEARKALEESKAREKAQEDPLKKDPWPAPSNEP